jgi:CHAD domain-containing protein
MSSSGTYRLGDGEPVPAGIARIATGRIDHAVEELSGRSDSTPEKAVHEARKDMKKLRAVLRLVRGELGDEVYRRENACFRDAAGLLSGVRDADVMLARLDALAEDGLDPAVVGRLRDALAEHRRGLEGGGDSREEVVGVLREARARIVSWPLAHDSFSAVEDGLDRVYRRGRSRFRAAAEEPSVEALHEWRKRVKDLWYFETLLRDAWRPVMEPMADEAHALSERLGDDHDLAVLAEWATARPETLGDASDGFSDLVNRRRRELQADAFALGARIYAERPGAFVSRLESYWRAWRGAAAGTRV